MSKENILNRKIYKDIKKYDRQQMEAFVESIYTSGFNDGVEKYEKLDKRKDIDFNKLRENIGAIKGIGEKKLDDIMKAIADTVSEDLMSDEE